MKATVYGAAAGGLFAGLVLVAGVTAAAWIAITLAVAASIFGAVDYVRTHG